VAVINGSIYDDTIQGTVNAGVMDANAGDDTMDGLGGDDALTGGPGSDLIMGGEGNDTVHAYAYTSGDWQDYLVVAVPGGFVLADKLGSVASNEVRGVEFFSFANGTFAADALPNLADAPVITITADRASQTEGTGGATALTFTVRLDRPADASLSVLVEATSMHSYDYDPDRTVFPGDLVGGSYLRERLVFAPGGGEQDRHHATGRRRRHRERREVDGLPPGPARVAGGARAAVGRHDDDPRRRRV